MNRSQYPHDVPQAVQQGGDRRIPKGPIYDEEKVLSLLKQERLTFWTRRARDDAQRYSLDHSDAALLLRDCLLEGRYRNSKWCRGEGRNNWAACDAYEITRWEWVENVGKRIPISYYLKFAIAQTGNLVLIISIHGG